MNNVNIADLKNNLSRYLARVREGVEFTVLDRDTPVARILPFAPRAAGGRGAGAGGAERQAARAHVTELQRLGILDSGERESLAAWVQGHEPVKLPKGVPRAVEQLLQMRRESTR
jgi:prevent-host-death family protein